MFAAADMLEIFQRHRGNALVIPGRGGRYWNGISEIPERDIPLGDPAMGGHASFAFGLAEARPDEKVVLFDSEGDVLMNLGALATIAELKPRNFYHFLMDNESYATTGGQPVPNATNISYAGVAREVGYASTHFYDDLEELAGDMEAILNEPGPVFIHMKIVPEIQNLPIGARPRWQTRTLEEVLRDVKNTLG
jgi:thiamine pyrophosphate-dependent acetolactate synthase large subunit-like protein